MPAPSGTVSSRGAPSGAPSQVVVPFSRSSREHIEQGGSISGIVMTGAAPGTYVLPIPAYGYLAGVLLTVTASGGTAPGATAYEDAPWSVLANVSVTDVNGTPIWQMDGYSAYLASKFGGYRVWAPDPATFTSAYSAPATSGDFTFTLPIWFQFGRDGLGCLPNMDAAASYRVVVVLNTLTAGASGPVLTAAPAGYPTLSLTVHGVYRSQPPAADSFGNRNQQYPPAVGTVAYWSSQSWSALSGAQNIQLTRVGNLIRNHILIFRSNADGTRATAETGCLPPTIQFDWDSGVRYIDTVAVHRLLEYMRQGILHPSGVVFYRNCADPDQIIGAEYGDSWMPTSGASKLALRFTPAAAANLTVLTNDIVPASAQVYGQ